MYFTINKRKYIVIALMLAVAILMIGCGASDGHKNGQHTYAVEIIESTCTEKGYTIYACGCGDSYVSDYVEEKGHDYVETVIEPSCTRQGYTIYTCRHCSDVYGSNYVNASGHEYETEITEASCKEQGYTTYTCECGDSYRTAYTAMLDHKYENGACTMCNAKEWDTDGDDILSILAIGNSFSVDALEYAYQIASSLGVEKIVIGNLYIGGCNLKTHASNITNDSASYTYYYNNAGTWSQYGGAKLSTALKSRSWDYISIQQASPSSGLEDTYNEDLTTIVEYVNANSTNINVKLVWHMTWAYQQGSTHSLFSNYNNDQETMYNAIVTTVQNKIVSNPEFDIVIPSGTAVQNSRTSLLGDTTTRDGFHMTLNYGRYLTGLTFIKMLTGLSIDNIEYKPSEVSELEKAIAIESVNNACATPFSVTNSQIDLETDLDSYTLLDLDITNLAFWNPTISSYNTLITNDSLSAKFFATKRFTKDELPVGSVIVLADGWKYRPDGWLTDEVQTSRESNTTSKYVMITEEWWGNYIFRAFNVSKTDGSSLEELSEDELKEVLKIYIPQS